MYKPQPNLMVLKPKSEAMLGEFPAEKRFVSEVKYPEEGGILSYFQNEKYPEKQLVYPEIFGFLNPFKRSLLFFAKLSDSFLGKIFIIFFLIFTLNKKIANKLFSLYVDMFWSGWSVVGINTQYYCVAARELYRAGLVFCGEDETKKRLLSMLVAFFECDNAYRYRIQDFFGILDKDSFIKNPSGEITRAINEFYLREQLGKSWLDGKIKLIIIFVKFLVHIPKYKKLLISIISEIDFNKIRLDQGDRYWCYHRTDYNADGLDLIDRMRKRALMKLN